MRATWSNTRCGQTSTRDWRSITSSGIEVGRGRRMTYTIRIEGADLDVDVIEFFRTHKEYEKRFHY
jgi:hypothetical protein